MTMIKETYHGHPMAINELYRSNGTHVNGFLAVTAGTITIVDNAAGTVLLNAMPLTVGFNRIPLNFFSNGGANIQLGGGASGTLLV